MKKITMIICLASLLGCTSQESSNYGPFTALKTFEVLPVFLTTKKSPKELTQADIVAALQEFGSVQMTSNFDKLINTKDSSSCLLVLMDKFVEGEAGALQVIGEVKVIKNNAKTTAVIWKSDGIEKSDALYPVDTPNGIVFERKQHVAVSSTPEEYLRSALAQFKEQYMKDNPSGPTPIFYVQNPNPLLDGK